MATSQMSEIVLRLRRAVFLRDGAGLTDGQLLENYLKRRDEAALAALVCRHGPMVWGVCRRALGNYHDAEDAFQATFLVLVRKAASIASRELLANWLYGVARQTALKARATAAKRKERERQVTQMPEPAAAKQDLWHDLQPLLDEELSRLPDKYRSAIVLCDLEGKTRKQAARQLGVPEGTVAGRLAKARTLLARRLARRGVVLSSGALAALLAQKAASAGVPTSVLSATIKAADLFAAGQAAAGVISVKVAALTEGVLKTMLLTKLKTAMAVLFVVGIVAVPATGLAYRAMAAEGRKQAQRPVVQSQVQVLDQEGAEKELRRLKAEVERLRLDIAELEKRLQQQVPTENAGDRRPVTKVYSVVGLISAPVGEGTGAESLMRIIVKIVEPASWIETGAGGQGSIEYYPLGRSLVIRQSPEIHKQVQALLDTLRKTKAEQEKADKDKVGS
jgi:RNA polymerase sigma factor (sigma-70 family)